MEEVPVPISSEALWSARSVGSTIPVQVPTEGLWSHLQGLTPNAVEMSFPSLEHLRRAQCIDLGVGLFPQNWTAGRCCSC